MTKGHSNPLQLTLSIGDGVQHLLPAGGKVHRLGRHGHHHSVGCAYYIHLGVRGVQGLVEGGTD